MFIPMTDCYFTSDSIKSYIINEIKPLNKDIFYDPAGGSGGFIEYALNYIRQNELSHLNFIQNVHANEQDKVIYELLKSNMTNNRISLNNIKNQNSLDLTWNHDVVNKFDCICSNPPFGHNQDIISCDNYWGPLKSGNNTIIKNWTAQFIMHIYNSLKYGGRCGVVIDLGLLFNGSDNKNSWQSKFRRYLLTNTDLYKIVLLEKGAFSYTNFSMCILFFVKGISTQEIEFKNFDDNTTITKLSIDRIISNNYSLNYLNYVISNDVNDQIFEIKVYQMSGEIFRSYIINDLQVNEIKLRKIFSDIPNDRLYKIVWNTELIHTNMYDIEINTVLSENLTIIFLDYDQTMINNIRTDALNLNNYPEYQDDIDIVKFAVNKNGSAISCASDSLQNNYDVVKLAVKSNGASFQYLLINYRYDPIIVKLAIQNTRTLILHHTSNDIQDNYDIVKLAIKQNKFSYNCASTRLKNDHSIIKLAIFYGRQIIYNILSDELKNNPDIVKFAIQLSFIKLRQLSENLRDNYDIVKSAIEIKSNNLQYASDNLKNNVDIVKLSVQKNGLNLQYASDNIKNNIEIVKLAVQQNENALQYVSYAIFKLFCNSESDENILYKITKPIFKEIYKLKSKKKDLETSYGIVTNENIIEVDNKINRLQTKLESIIHRFKNICTDQCQICLEDYTIEKPCVLPCCNQLCCEVCLKNLNSSCPLCRIPFVMKNINFISEIKLQENTDIIKLFIQKDGVFLKYLDDNFKNNSEIVTLAIQNNWKAFRHATNDLKNDFEMATFAVKQNGMNLQFVSSTLQKNVIIIKFATEQNPNALQYASNSQNNELDCII